MTPAEMYAAAKAMEPAWGDDGPDRDDRRARAMALFEDAAKAGHQPAMETLARKSRIEWAIACAKLGHSLPLRTLFDDRPELSAQVLEAAEAGEVWAETVVAAEYYYRRPWLPDVPDARAEGRRRLDAIVERGWPPALLFLTEIIRYEDPGRTAALLIEALPGLRWEHSVTLARQRLVEALDGSGAPLSERVATREAMAADGHVESMLWLGDAHRTGKQLPKDLGVALSWYERAAALHDPIAHRELGKLYEFGRGVKKDLETAKDHYEAAAELGNDAYAKQRLVKTFGLGWYGT